MHDSGIKIEVHLIQNFAPSNLNRDDTGQPKSATFGGFRRARISSQCSKRGTRNMWRESGSASVGERTKLLKSRLAPQLAANGRTQEQIGTALNTFLAQFYSKMDGEKTAVLIDSGFDVGAKLGDSPAFRGVGVAGDIFNFYFSGGCAGERVVFFNGGAILASAVPPFEHRP